MQSATSPSIRKQASSFNLLPSHRPCVPALAGSSRECATPEFQLVAIPTPERDQTHERDHAKANPCSSLHDHRPTLPVANLLTEYRRAGGPEHYVRNHEHGHDCASDEQHRVSIHRNLLKRDRNFFS